MKLILIGYTRYHLKLATPRAMKCSFARSSVVCLRFSYSSKKNIWVFTFGICNDFIKMSNKRPSYKAIRNQRKRKWAEILLSTPTSTKSINPQTIENYQSSSTSAAFGAPLSKNTDIEPNKDVTFDLMKIPYCPIQPTFDMYMVSSCFTSVNPEAKKLDQMLKEAIEERMVHIIPTQDEISKLTSIVSKLLVVFDRLKNRTEQIDACKIESYYVVGSLRMDTMLRSTRMADLTLVLRTLPVKAALSALANKLMEELQRLEPTNPYQVNIRDDGLELYTTGVLCESDPSLNIEENYKEEIIRVLVATIPSNLGKLNREIHIKRNVIQKHLKAIEHVKWFEDNIKSDACPSSSSNFIAMERYQEDQKREEDIKSLVRLTKDLGRRFPEFRLFSPWMIIILAHYCVTRTGSGTSLPLYLAFKRMLQVLSSGIFLPYSAGIVDPCEPKMPIHGKLSVHDQERITRCAQSLLRMINYNKGCRYIMGLEPLNFNEFQDEVLQFDNVKFGQTWPIFNEDTNKPLEEYPDFLRTDEQKNGENSVGHQDEIKIN